LQSRPVIFRCTLVDLMMRIASRAASFDELGTYLSLEKPL
jgi:hypothetical protein